MDVDRATTALTVAASRWPARLRATATLANSLAGSLSPSSIETQATFRPCNAAHCASTVVLPYPSGATTETTCSSPLLNIRSTSAVPG